MNQAIQLKDKEQLTIQELECLNECLTRFIFIEGCPMSGGSLIVDTIELILITRLAFITDVGQAVAKAWRNHPDCKFSTWKDFTFRAIVTYTRADLERCPSATKQIKGKAPTAVIVDELWSSDRDTSSPHHYSTARVDLVDAKLSILNVKIPDYSAVRCGGSVRPMNFSDIEGALSFAKIDEIGCEIVRVIHRGDEQSIIKLVSLMTDKFIETKRKQGKELCGGKQDVVRKLVSVALFDLLQPTDKRPVSIRERASIAGIAQTTYRRLGHDSTVDSIIEQMSDRYAVARTKLYQQLVSQ